MTKEKQIEEIDTTIRSAVNSHFVQIPQYSKYGGYDGTKEMLTRQIAVELYNAGYRKQSAGEWVLHKPRRENRNATYKCSVCGKLCSSYYNDVGEWKCCPHCFAKMKGGTE